MAGVQTNIRTFRAPLKGPGRLAPTLLEDLTLYDPYRDSVPGRNLLNDPPVNFGNTDTLQQVLPDSSCRHAFYIQPRRTKGPALDERPSQTSVYHVTAFCRLCAVHVSLTVDYTRNWSGTPCPNEERPVHHLVQSTYNQQLARSWSKRLPQSSEEVYVYECSSTTCGVIVTVSLSPAVLSKEEEHTLTDLEKLKARTDAAFEARQGDTEGMKRPSPTDVLVDLRAYIRNSWRKEARSEIALDNKRFAVRFGPDGDACKEVLDSLGFRLKPGEAWQVPKISQDDNIPLEDNFNIFLDNLEHELSALILRRPSEERLTAQDTTTLEDAGKEFARALGCQAYDQTPSARTAGLTPGSRSSFFIVLGTPQNASDDLIKHAYDWQCWSCPEYAPTFLSALRDIALMRDSEDLNYRVAIEVSNGKIDAEQLGEAHKALGVPMNIQPDADESHIIGTFNARLQDSPAQEAQLREHLRIIGTGLNSRRIMDYAAREITTYEQALDFLSANPATSDEWIQSLYSVKLEENSSLRDLAVKAIKIIAMHRQSKSLTTWIDTGFTSEVATDMDVGEAYSAMDITDRTMDDATILTVYEIRKQEDPASTDRFVRALSAIARDRNSTILLSELQIEAPERPKAFMSEPVGLDNIGNTCYLNSLLQSLFTIRQVREVVLDFGEYQMNTSPENMSVKKVGQRKISLKEVETAQKFVRNLAKLFQRMITTPRQAIRPEEELARLTLETDTIEKIRRRSTLAGGNRPSLGSIDNKLIQGPSLPPLVQASGDAEDSLASTFDALVTSPEEEPVKELGASLMVDDGSMNHEDDDNSSEATLVSRPSSVDHMDLEAASAEQQQSILDNKENLSPLKLSEIRGSPTSSEPLRPASPSKINVQAGALANKPVNEQAMSPEQHVTIDEQPIKYQPPPGPPPIPPRKPVATSIPTLEEYARQQDVTEVFNHCVLQLSCAIRATGFEKSGEQKDEIHDLFFGDSRIHLIPDKEVTDPDPFLNVMAQINNLPKDVYAALDNNHDISDFGRKTYISITKLPPILTVAFGRVVWDEIKKGHAKLENFVEMPETLYMDRYLESSPDSELTQRRIQSWELKRRLGMLNEEKAYLEGAHAGAKDIPGLFDDTKRALLFLRDVVAQDEEYGGPIPIDPSLPETMGDLASRARDRLTTVIAEIDGLTYQLTNLFNDMQEHQYRLHAVFFHRGSYGSGHYWIYIRDHKSGVWRKYNDDHVTIVQDTKEIFGKPETTGGWSGPANAYFLIYVKAGKEGSGVDDLVETVKREPIGIETKAPEDFPPQNVQGLGDDQLVPLGSTAEEPYGPSQMTEMPPRKRFDIDATAAWADETSANHVQKQGDWDSSEAQVSDPGTWYR